MKLERLTLHGFSPAFPGVVDLAFRDLPPGVYALVGENGAGKTTLLETVPGALYRQMPSNDGADPVTYATARDSYLDVVYAFDGLGVFRSRLNLDGPKRQTDAVLEQLLPDGTHVPLNDGKRSTYDESIRARFPSLDLFVNSSFAAQGRGDEFTRRPPSKRKDLFVEFLGLAHLAEKAAKAADAGVLCADAKLRLEVVVEQLAAQTTAAIADAIEQDADVLQTDSGTAEVRQRELKTAISHLQNRLALLADQVAANAAASDRVQTLARELAGRQGERVGVTRQRESVAATFTADQQRLARKRDADLADAETTAHATLARTLARLQADVAEATKKIAGNHQIQQMADAIRAAIAAQVVLDAQIVETRLALTGAHADQRQVAEDLRQAESQLAALTPIAHDFTRATSDANLLLYVPCGGEGEYAACQFLVNAKAAEARIGALATALRPKAELADRVGALLRTSEATATRVADLQAAIATLEATRASHDAYAKYATALAESTERVAQLEAAKAKAEAAATHATDEAAVSLADALARVRAAADERVAEAQQRHDARLAELDAQALTLENQIAQLTRDHATAEAEQAATAAGNTQATALQLQLDAARADWDGVTATLATVTRRHEDLARRRQALAAARTRLADLQQRQARVDQELVEWRDLAKALSKGGLPDLEIDAAGPGISATANELLRTCAGPRYTMELVTQVQKADGSGLKDEFTVRVIDNERGGDWRDIKAYSGGQKTILQEALMCAIALYVNARAPMPIRTLWRDETGAALDPENAVRYVEMLRRVRTIGGLHHVFFISHHPEAAARADAQIRVGDGQAVIVYPPYAEVA